MDRLDVTIRDPSIRLGQLLKLAGVADDGAHARTLLDEGLVTVDGEAEGRRGRQVRPGDVVLVQGGTPDGGDVELTVSRR